MLEQLIDAYARRTEIWLFWTRLLIITVGLADDYVYSRQPGSDPARPRAALVMSVVGVAALLGLRAWLARARRIVPLLAASIAFDSVFCFALISPVALWPEPGYTGILHTTEIAVIALAIVAAGYRFNLRLAIAGTAFALVAGAGLVAIDAVRQPAAFVQDQSGLVGAVVLVIGATTLSIVISARIRRLVYDGATLAAQAERARERFRLYLSEQAAREVLDSVDEEISLDGEQRHVAVLFCDLREFTRYASSADPKRLVAELNAYFDAMVPAIQGHGGTVDKFIGDAIMAVFSREDGRRDPAGRAIEAAIAMHQGLALHNDVRAAHRLPPLRHGIGIHAGYAVAGNVGTANRLQYTVIGDVVNVAARLERATKDARTWLLVSRPTWEEAQRAAARARRGNLPELASLGLRDLRGVGALEVFGPPEDEVELEPLARDCSAA